MRTEDWLDLMLAEAAVYPSDDPDHMWRMNAARAYARIIAGRLDEDRTADEVLADAMMKEAA